MIYRWYRYGIVSIVIYISDYHDPEISGTDEDDDDDDVKNFSLITTFWRCFNNLYRTRRLCAISPLPLLEYYFYADVSKILFFIIDGRNKKILVSLILGQIDRVCGRIYSYRCRNECPTISSKIWIL